MSEPNPEGEEPYEIPGTQPALEPADLPGQPLTAAKAACFVSKVIS